MEFGHGRTWIFRIPTGQDLWRWLDEFGRRQKIGAGRISAIGAVSEAALAIYDQHEKVYVDREIRQPMELVSCSGNYSLKDGVPFPHVHVVFATNEGTCLGGHLIPGTTVFVAEVVVVEGSGAELRREPDEITGLPMWPAER